MDPLATVTTLELRNGALHVAGWPADVRRPFGLDGIGTTLTGPARLRAAVLAVLAAAGRAVDDRIAPAALEAVDAPPPPEPTPELFEVWRAHGGRGLVAGLAEARRVDFVLAALRDRLARTLIVVRDSGAQAAWVRVLRGHGIDATDEHGAAVVATTSAAASTMHWRARRHDLLVVDRPEQQPGTTLSAVLDDSPARARVGFVDREGHDIVRWARGLGALLGGEDRAAAPRRLELRLPLTRSERTDHDAAWHTFLRAYDAFAALQPDAGFGSFVRRARGEPAWRDSLLAWHRALRIAGWNTAKAATCADLLHRHRSDRVLVFTPDRHAAYELARAHLVAPVTAELSRHERERTLGAFAGGRLRALVGPRLLDLGVPEGSADVGILVGGGFGSAQHSARCRRVAATGVVYELVALDTVEVGRARRFGRSLAAPAAAGDGEPR